jgi:hypothetical protein
VGVLGADAVAVTVAVAVAVKISTSKVASDPAVFRPSGLFTKHRDFLGVFDLAEFSSDGYVLVERAR